MSVEPPVMRLVSPTTLLSLGLQLLLVILAQVASFVYYIFLAVIFSKGPPYRRPMYSNLLFLANVLFAVGINVFLTVYEGQSVLDSMSWRPWNTDRILFISTSESTVEIDFEVPFNDSVDGFFSDFGCVRRRSEIRLFSVPISVTSF
ncbi:unnamed protein product [Dibothriocephalus latus]|uniref:Uncharacterized protein n=1 Tax=Dibothriocephalus latus TaxID=60516 RepID=A0A3P7NG78_DIBLA|nr:unnamed protein product [Dibothriocephalus latus]